MHSPWSHHMSPRAEKTLNLTLSRCQRLSQGAGERRRLFTRPAWPRRTLLWHDHQRASRKPVPPFPSSLRHHVSPRAGKIVHLTLSRCQRLSQDAGARRRLSNGIFFSRGSACSHSRAGIGLGTTIKYPQSTTTKRPGNCSAYCEWYRGNGLGTSIKYLRRTTSGVAGNGLRRYQGLLMCPFTTSALDSPCLLRTSFAKKRNSNTEGWGFGAQCMCVEPELSPCVH
jgi:hypothetical protein